MSARGAERRDLKTSLLPDGTLALLAPRYVSFPNWDNGVSLDGDFSAAELRWLADQMDAYQQRGKP